MSISRAYSYAGTASTISGKASPRALNPPAGTGGRTSACRAGSPWRFTFPSMSLSSLLFASIVRLFQPATSSVGPRPLSEHALFCSPFLYLAFTCRSTAVLTSCLLVCEGASTVDTFSSVPGGRVFDGEYDETVSALVHRKCF